MAISLIVYSKINSEKGLEAKVIKPQKGVITSSISGPGKVITKQRSEIVAMVNSRVTQVHVKEGQLVQQGALLIALDDREALAKINSDKAMLFEARAKKQQAKRNLEALETVYKAGGISLSSLQDAELQYTVAQTAEERAASDVHSSSLALEQFKLLAPFAGIIVKRSVEVGDGAVPGVSLLSLADPTTREIEVTVDESDGAFLRLDQEVDISCEALPNRTWTEKIVRIETAINKDGSANILKTYAGFSNNIPEVRLGQQVDAKIKIAEKKDVYKVPFDAVIEKDGKSYFATVNQGKVHFEPVTTGLEDFTSVEILPPVPDKEVILREGKNLVEGQPVSLTRRVGG